MEAILFDFENVLHQTSLTPLSINKIVDEIKVLEPWLRSLTQRKAIVSNEPKEIIEYILQEANMDDVFELIYGGLPNQNKVSRLEMVMYKMNTDHVLFIDNKEKNVHDALENDIPAIKVNYQDLVQFVGETK
jgi:phosphoglycolate phosphatase-like HAD superfamily hydrolase